MRHGLVLVVLASTPLAASGQGFIVSSNQLAQANAQRQAGGVANDNFGQTQDFSGNDFYGIEDRIFALSGFSGRGYAEHGATFSPSNPGIGGAFSSVVMDSCTSAEIFTSSPTSQAEFAFGLASGTIVFNVLTAQNWSWNGGWQGSTIDTGIYHEVSGAISLMNVTTGAFLVQESRSSVNGVGDWFDPINFAGQLGPGQYQLEWSHRSVVANGSTSFGSYPNLPGGLPLVSCINSTFSLSAIPSPGTAMVMGLGLVGAVRRRR